MTKSKHITLIIQLCFSLLIIFLFSSSHIAAVIMWGHTGAPTETTCVSCHSSYALNSGPGTMQITAIPGFIGNQYIPGQTYTITITVSQPSDSTFACDVEVIDSSGNDAGTITNTSIYTQLHTYLPNGRTNIFGSATNPGSVTFTFNWTAPLSGSADIYATGMQTNTDGTFNGDFVYSDSLVNITPVNASGIIHYLQDKSVELFPNPVNSVLHIKSKDEIKQVTFYNTSGEKLMEDRSEKTATILHFDISHFVPGEYTLIIATNKGIIIDKLIKQ